MSKQSVMPETSLAAAEGSQTPSVEGLNPQPAATLAARRATPSSTATLTLTPKPTSTPTVTPTPDPYAGLTITDLASRSYGDGEFSVEETLKVTEAFTRSLVTYSSDGLTIYGFMNVPRGEGPFPVVLVLHGYVDPDRYDTLAYTTRYADSLARTGYLVIHPNFRNYPPSDEGPDTFRVGYAVDALNLVALVQQQGDQAGPLESANPDAIGLWGHSMGGGIAIRVITVNPDVEAAVLYGSMSGDERENYERILAWSGGQSGEKELATPDEALRRISPIYHLDRVSATVSIHHGEADETVPLDWSLDLCERLQALNKVAECFTYPDQPHTFQGDGDELFVERTVDFLDRYLRAQ